MNEDLLFVQGLENLKSDAAFLHSGANNGTHSD